MESLMTIGECLSRNLSLALLVKVQLNPGRQRDSCFLQSTPKSRFLLLTYVASRIFHRSNSITDI